MMTPPQLLVLKADILIYAAPGGPLETWYNVRRDDLIAGWYNEPSTFIIWRKNVEEAEIYALPGFAWDEVDALSAGKARIWEWMFHAGTVVSFERQNVRDGVMNVWTGTAAKLAVRDAVMAHVRRPATRAENLFTTGTGTIEDPGLRGAFEGALTTDDVSYAIMAQPPE